MAGPVFGNVGAITDTNLTIPFGAGSTGDLLFMAWESDQSADNAAASGWTGLKGSYTHVGGGTHALGYLWKIATTGTSGSQAFTGMSTSPFCTSHIYRYSGTDGVTPINVGQVEADSITTTAITTTVANCMELAILSYDAGSASATAPSGWTRRVDGTSTENWYGAERLKVTAGATTTSTFQSANSAGVGIIHVALQPAAGAASIPYPSIYLPTTAMQRASSW